MSSTKLVVGAIDFGTTFSGYAFSFAHDYNKDPMKIQANHWIGGGHMSLKTLSRKTLLYDENKKTMLALQVFSSAIKFLKDHLCEEMSKKMTGFEEDDIFWVLTVPAIWTDAAKKFMREAAQMAGIPSECLSLALEPEAASVFCKLLPVDRLKFNASTSLETFKPGTNYIVLDLGGGTVDVTVHRVESDGRLNEIARVSGGAWGGTQVDEAYQRFLEELYGDEVFQAFRQNNTGDFLEMLREFEIKKRTITKEKKGNIVLRFAASLSETYRDRCGKPLAKHKLPVSLESSVQLKRDKMHVDANIMKQFFSDSITNTSKHVKKILQENEFSEIDTILLVGGFAESELIQESIKEAFSNKRIIVPNEPGLAVLKGAVLLGHNPLVMKSRISKYTYGIEVTNEFIDGESPEEFKIFEDGVFRCRYEFKIFVRVGERVPVGTVVTKPFISNAFDVEEGVKIYASTEEDPTYVVDDSCFLIGTVHLDKPRQQFLLEMHFGEAEICLKFIFQSGDEKTEELDFLCT